MPIKLGIDADSSPIRKLGEEIKKVGSGLRDAQGRFTGVGAAGRQAGAGMHAAAGGATAFGRATASAARGLAGFNSSLGSTASLARAAQGALSAFVGMRFISDLQRTTGELQKINMTFQAVFGSAEAAAREMAYVSETADKLGQDILTSAGAYAKLLASSQAANISLQDSRNIYEGITAAATSFGLSQYELEGALNAVQQMISKGSVQAEELRGQLGERLPGAFSIAAKSMDMTVQELSKALELGNVRADEFVRKFGAQLQKQFGGFAATAETTGRAVNELGNAMLKLKIAIIEGGFQEALVKVLDTMTAIAASGEAATVARALGEAFKFMAEHAEIAAVSIGLIVSQFTPWGKIASIVAGVTVAILSLTQRTMEFGGEQVKIGAVINEFWDGAVRLFKAGGEVIVAVWEVIKASAASIPPALKGQWAVIKADFADLAFWITQKWQGVLIFLQSSIRGNSLLNKFMTTTTAQLGEQIALATEQMAGYKAASVEATAEANKQANVINDKMTPALNELAIATAKFRVADAESTWTDAAQRAADQAVLARVETEKMIRLKGKQAELQREEAARVAAAIAAQTKADKAGAAGADARAKAMESATEEIKKQQEAYTDIAEKLARVGGESDFVRDEMEKITDILDEQNISLDEFLHTLGLTRSGYISMLRETEKMTKQLEIQEGLASAIGGSFSAMGKAMLQMGTSGGGMKDALGGMMTSISETLQGPFVEAMDKTFDDLGKKLATTMTKVGSSGLGQQLGLGDPTVMAGLGSGLGMAAAGAIQGNSAAIGSGIGMAAGTVIGNMIFPGIGGIIGGMLGSAAGSLFGGGDEDKWKKPTGIAFEGTTFASEVTGSRNVNVEAGASQAGKFAFLGVQNLLADFNKELREFVEAAGGDVKRGTALVIDQNDALKKMTGTLSDRTVNRHGETEEQAGARIAAKIDEIMNLASALVQSSGPALSQAQVLWRETQERFSATNKAILRDLGFAAKEINALQKDVQDEIRSGFDREIVQGLVDTGRASKRELEVWRDMELDELSERRRQSIRTAREIGGDVKMVQSYFRAERKEIGEQYRDMLDDMVKSTSDAAKRIARLQDRLQGLDKKRADVLGELTRRADEMRKAEEGLRNARRALAVSDLAPGGPMDQFKALRKQFEDAVKAAKGGDAGAAALAASLAQQLLGAGQGVFASGTGYTDLFRDVNKTLLGLQKEFGGEAGKLEKRLDAETFTKTTERSTKALLRALGRINETMDDVRKEIDRQTKRMELDNRRNRVGKNAA